MAKHHMSSKLHNAIDLALLTCRMNIDGIHDHAIPYVIGTPGGGKTRLFAAECKKRNWPFLHYTPALERLEKFGGIPEIQFDEHNELHTLWSIPQMICDIRGAARSNDENTPIVVLLDDWHLCSPQIQQIGFELFTYKSLNNHTLPDNVQFVLAGNEKSAAGAKVQLSAIKNRCMIFYADTDIDYWIDNYAIPNNLHSAGITFFQNRENWPYFHEDESTTEQFASPRSWTSAFNMLKYMETQGKASDQCKAMIEGNVGPEAAAKFWMYYTIYSKIDTAKIFDKGIIELPENTIEMYAFGGAVSAEYYHRATVIYNSKSRTKKEELKKLGSVLEKCIGETTKKNYTEITMMMIKNIIAREENEKLNLPSGRKIMADMITSKQINPKLLEELQKRNQKLQELGRTTA